ncbi:LCP family protein [Faecalicatena contorta]|uniref:Cell envelope-related function transcriptional attenuator common domain-containing protein n=1 Tax=Faecalicatena contorta TaxID=39482 RepID=A0A315ZUR1_9FIRM|nr:LCP family protein [Faecalicatena contorta]PWJ48384.1 LytR family transcriptional attenuator [Faecalicatena contorta]SUQ15407.1 cell envelope-related function transcriptional attenuator common domain-containing protein [Faecalicatena contorta]
MAGKKSKIKMTRQQHALLHKKKMRKRIILLVIEVIILLALGAAAYAMSKLDKLEYQTLNEDDLEIYQDTGDYTNIALFGLDSREGELDGGVRSDAMMVASINNKTGNVKVVSIFRDTLTQQSDGTYEKANSAYSYGGPQEAVALLNRNFDLDIKKYMSVDFNALADVIDLLGGIELELTDEEVYWTNGYATETSKVVGRTTTELTQAGKQTLDGIQAVSYTRIRYTEGDDFKRSERQRLVLQQVVEKAKKASLPTLNKIIDQVLPQVSTNLSASDFMGIAANAVKYQLGEMKGFPFDVTTSENVIGLEGSYVVAIGFADNVKQMHAFLFDKNTYQPSEKVQSIDSDIIYLTGINGNDYAAPAGSEGNEDANSYTGDGGYTDDGSYDDGSSYTDDGTYDYQDNSGSYDSEW